MRLSLLFLACALTAQTVACGGMIDIHASADGYLDFTGGGAGTIVDNSTQLLVSNDATTGKISTIEFDISALQNSTINSATLFLSWTGSSGGSSGIMYQTGVYNYAGNGTIEAADFVLNGAPETQSFTHNSSSNLEISVASDVQFHVNQADGFIGFTINQEGGGSFQRAYRSLEANTATTGFNPTLRVDFTENFSAAPEPSGALCLLALCIGGFCRRQPRQLSS